MRTYKENAELFLNYLYENDCDKTGYFADEPVELAFDGDCYTIRLYSQVAEFLLSFMKDGTVTVYTKHDYENLNNNRESAYKEFTDFNSFCDWYKTQDFTWTSDLGHNISKLKEDLNKEYIIINTTNDVKKYSKQFKQLLKEAIIEDENSTMIDKFNETWNKDDDDFEEAYEWLQQKLAGITENNYKWAFSTYEYTDSVEISLTGEYQHIASKGKNKGKYILDGGSITAYVDVKYGHKYTFKELKRIVDFN